MLKRLWQNIGAARAGRTGSDSTIVVANPLRAFAEKNTDGRLMDKWVHYFDIYHRHLNRFRGQAITMVEIGVFNGGKLDQADTFIERTKTMIDRLNAWHIPGAALPPDEFTRTTGSLHFYSGVVVIERHAQQAPLERAYGTMRDFRYVAPSLAGRLYAPH